MPWTTKIQGQNTLILQEKLKLFTLQNKYFQFIFFVNGGRNKSPGMTPKTETSVR